MFKHWLEIVSNHDNAYRDWLFHKNVFPLRESTSICLAMAEGFTLDELFRSPFTEL